MRQIVRVVCVDDEKLVLKQIMSLCEKVDRIDETNGFTSSSQALEFIAANKTDVALVDINMPDMNGLALAARIKQISPDTSIVFVTGYSEYAVDAFKLHASGYLVKPVDKDDLESEIDHALSSHTFYMDAHITAQTFGDFELFIDGKTVLFGRSKSKELLAYLIEKRGKSITRGQAFEVLYEDKEYDRSMQKQFDNVIRNLRDVLKQYGAQEIFVLERGAMRIKPELIDCDMYRLLDGDVAAINAYHGEYMNQYTWSNVSEAYASRIKGDK
ncbi:MAG: response regulator [Ruminococcus sp.]|nr:response regulator [Ruminococcus sp.]